MAAITEELLNQLQKANDINSFFEANSEYFINKTADVYLNELIGLKKLSISEIAKKSGTGEYTYKIFNGERNGSRNILISIAFGMNLSLEETQILLRLSKFSILDSRDKRDSIIIYGITHNLSVFKTDDLLSENNFVTVK